MHHVTGRNHDGLAARLQTQPALVVDGGRGADDFLAAGQLGAHGVADGQAARPVVGGQRPVGPPGGATPPPLRLPSSVSTAGTSRPRSGSGTPRSNSEVAPGPSTSSGA